MKSLMKNNLSCETNLMSPLYTYSLRLLAMVFLAGVVLTARAEESATSVSDPAAVAVVEKLHASLLESMQKADTQNYRARYDALAPVIESVFDTALISQVILSRYWNELSTEKQQNFIDLFRQLSISTYASRFDAYNGESFKTLGVEALKKGRLLIKTELVKPDDKPVKFDYLVHQNQGNWYIISVIANGVNDLSLKRAEYASIINEKGFDYLVNEIQNKIRDSGTSSGSP